MAALDIRVKTRRMPISTQLFRFSKGVEHLYYVLLFTSSSYAGKTEPWTSWLDLGFHVAIREAPPAAMPTDRLKVDSRVNGKPFELAASSANRGALRELQALLQDLDQVRRSLAAHDEEARAQAVLGDKIIQRRLLAPLKSGLDRSGISPQGKEAFLVAVRRGLVALTDDEIETVTFSMA